MKYKHLFIPILSFLTFLQIAGGQTLLLSDLKKVAVAKSVDQADSVLRLRNYKIEFLPDKNDSIMLRYTFTKSSIKGKMQMLNLTVSPKIPMLNIAQAIFDYDTDFYRLKNECENLPNIKKVKEKYENDKFDRIYKDEYFYYKFSMYKDELLGMGYTVIVSTLSTIAD